ncbi:MAG: hypothetical protein R3F34_19690 [Planctomycetota bacterium]
MFRRRRPKRREPDWFVCPVCGSDVPVGALACKECGSDDETGWSEDTAYDGLDLPEAPLAELHTFDDFLRLTRRPPWWKRPLHLALVAFLIVAIFFGWSACIG